MCCSRLWKNFWVNLYESANGINRLSQHDVLWKGFKLHSTRCIFLVHDWFVKQLPRNECWVFRNLVRGGMKHEIYAAAFGRHLWMNGIAMLGHISLLVWIGAKWWRKSFQHKITRFWNRSICTFTKIAFKYTSWIINNWHLVN